MKVIVQRAFLLGGQPQGVGSTVEVSDALGRELIYTGKAAPAAPTPAPSGPMTTKTAAAVVGGARPPAKTAAPATPPRDTAP